MGMDRWTDGRVELGRGPSQWQRSGADGQIYGWYQTGQWRNTGETIQLIQCSSAHDGTWEAQTAGVIEHYIFH